MIPRHRVTPARPGPARSPGRSGGALRPPRRGPRGVAGVAAAVVVLAVVVGLAVGLGRTGESPAEAGGTTASPLVTRRPSTPSPAPDATAPGGVPGALVADDAGGPAGARATGPVAPGAGDAGPHPEPGSRPVARDVPGPPDLDPADRAAGLLARDVPEAASGVLDVVPGAQPAPRPAAVRSVRVEVERGLPVDGAVFALTVMATLNDPRGWGARGEVSFARTDGPADLRVVLASPALVDALCAPLDTAGQVSCGRNGHAALNFRRWVEATDEFADRTQYRQYLVNHEVGHLLGHPHEPCPGAGQPAPIMQQQTLGVAPCLPNGWPYPHG